MIATLTLNPSLDRTLEVDTLVRGAVLRARSSRVEAGGKGVNVSRALAANSVDTLAIFPIGGAEGEQHLQLLSGTGIDLLPIPIAGSTRTNVSLVEPNGVVTKINAPGPFLEGNELDSLLKMTVEALRGIEWLAICGSLAAGVPPDLLLKLISEAHHAGVKVAVDTSGEPLAAALVGGPDIIKPNKDELSALTGSELLTIGDVVRAAQRIVQRGVGAVLVSLGSDGAVLVDGTDARHAFTSAVVPRSNVGAGDAALAGFLASNGGGTEGLHRAVAWGAAAVRLPGSAMPAPQHIDLSEVQVVQPDPGRGLRE